MQTFSEIIKNNSITQIIGTPNAYTALMAEKLGAKVIYLSGGVQAAFNYGLPDLGITSLENVLVEVERITDCVNIPLLVDIDTGWGDEFHIERTIKKMIKAGASAVHMEDQVSLKRCGHRSDKKIVAQNEMVDKIQIAIDAKKAKELYFIARTDSFEKEGLKGAIKRAQAYVEAGADAIFAEALSSLEDYKIFTQEINAPILANITEFGKTPIYSVDELASVGVKMLLYPVSLTRLMNKASEEGIKTILNEGTQENLIKNMQTRQRLYEFLDYKMYEKKADQLLK
jgi:methylisocitrate lyase